MQMQVEVLTPPGVRAAADVAGPVAMTLRGSQLLVALSSGLQALSVAPVALSGFRQRSVCYKDVAFRLPISCWLGFEAELCRAKHRCALLRARRMRGVQ